MRLSALCTAIALSIHITSLSATAAEHVASPSAQQIQQSLAFVQARMAHYHVPGLSIACIHNGTVEWTRAFGVARLGGATVSPDTLWQFAVSL